MAGVLQHRVPRAGVPVAQHGPSRRCGIANPGVAHKVHAVRSGGVHLDPTRTLLEPLIGGGTLLEHVGPAGLHKVGIHARAEEAALGRRARESEANGGVNLRLMVIDGRVAIRGRAYATMRHIGLHEHRKKAEHVSALAQHVLHEEGTQHNLKDEHPHAEHEQHDARHQPAFEERRDARRQEHEGHEQRAHLLGALGALVTAAGLHTQPVHGCMRHSLACHRPLVLFFHLIHLAHAPFASRSSRWAHSP